MNQERYQERYEITRLIGKGRTGGVYLATDHQLNRAIVIRRIYSDSLDTPPSEYSEQFSALSHALSEIRHPSLLSIQDAGCDADGVYLASLWVEGTHLSKVFQCSPADQSIAYSMALQLLDALATAHAAGFIHGALTPNSVLRRQEKTGEFRFTILDLGLPHLASLVDPKFAHTGVMSDPVLLAPEIFSGQSTTERTDCYMLGQLIYLSLLGTHPFSNKTCDQLRALHRAGATPQLGKCRRDISPAFAKWLRKLSHPNPKKRYPSAAIALIALSRCDPAKGDRPKTSLQKVPGALITVIILLTLCTLSTYFILRKDEQPQPQISAVTARSAPAASPQVERVKPATQPVATPAHFDTTAITEQILHATAAEKSHPRTAADVSNHLNTDWTVFTGPSPNQDNYARDSTGVIGAVQSIGNLTASRAPVSNLLFHNDSSKALRPSLCAKCEHAGDGWKVALEQLSALHGPRAVTVHFTTWNCDAVLQFAPAGTLAAAGSASASSHFSYTAEAQSTSYAVRYTFREGSFHALDTLHLSIVSAAPKAGKEFGISLSAIIVE